MGHALAVGGEWECSNRQQRRTKPKNVKQHQFKLHLQTSKHFVKPYSQLYFQKCPSN